jgi:hypothetical protein
MKHLFIFLLLFSSLYALPTCSPELRPALNAIHAFPEGKRLIEEVEKEGAVHIYQAPFNGESRAMWNSVDRSIVINSNCSPSYGSVIRSIVFEHYNAKKNREFLHIDWLARTRQITKSEYVESIERLEHQNALAVCDLLERGFKQGYFPYTSRWWMPRDFDHYYSTQKSCGHSDVIAAYYDSIMRRHMYG